MKYSSDLKLGEGLCIFTSPFISQILDFNDRAVALIFILIYFEWRDTENQQFFAVNYST